MKNPARPRGFSLIELMVTIAVIGFLMVLALPSLGNSVRVSRERGMTQRFVQDFTWARGAAGAADASALMAGLTGAFTLKLTLQADCSWATTITTAAVPGGTTEPGHTMTLTDINKSTSGILCSSAAVGATPALTFPITFTFSPQGYVSTSGNVTVTGPSGQIFLLNVLSSGSIVQGNSAS